MSDKNCVVCGDKGDGNNFNALTCVSCKAFFRRHALKNKESNCYFDDKCEINVVTRKFCQKCRLTKCLQVGMRKDLILTDEEKRVIKLKIEENKRKKINKSIKTNENIIDSTTGENRNTRKRSTKQRKTSESNDSVIVTSTENKYFDSTQSVNSSESSRDLIYSDTTDANSLKIPEVFDLDFEDIDIEDVNTKILEIESYIKEKDDSNEISDKVYETAVELEFAVIPIARPLTDYRNNFNELEGNKLTELLNATKVANFGLISPESARNDIQTIWAMKCVDEVRDIIEISKHLTSFNSICENDRVSLIKYGSMEMFCLRSVGIYDRPNEKWTLNLDQNISISVKLETMKNHSMDIYIKYRKFLNHLSQECDSDLVLLDLLLAIVLFDSNRPNLMHKRVVKLQQHIYLYLLKRYLLLKYRSECEANVKFLKLLNSLIDLNSLCETKKNYALSLDPNTIHPLIQEIYEINSNAVENSLTSNILVY